MFLQRPIDCKPLSMDGATTTELCHQHLRWHQRACMHLEEQILPKDSAFRWLCNPLSESASSLRCEGVAFLRRWRWRWHALDIATRFSLAAPRVDGSVYDNQGMQFVRLQWGRVVEDRLYEDAHRLEQELQQRLSLKTSA